MENDTYGFKMRIQKGKEQAKERKTNKRLCKKLRCKSIDDLSLYKLFKKFNVVRLEKEEQVWMMSRVSYQKFCKIKSLKIKMTQRMWQIIWRYELYPDEYLTILDMQGGGCAICKIKKNDPFDFCVDHDHKTGKVRGLLCSRCNRTLGFVEDSVFILQNAIIYLQNAPNFSRGS